MTLNDETNETPETEDKDEVEFPLDGDDDEEVNYDDDTELGQYLEDACWN